MRFISTAFVFALLGTAPLASAQKAIDITPDYIAGIHLGMTKAKAISLLTKPVQHDQLEDGYERYTSPKQKVAFYLRRGVKGVAVVTTWNRQLVTGDPLSPCSTVSALRRAYSGKLTPFRLSGRLEAYRAGNLVFTVRGTRIGAIALGRGTQATYVALNTQSCR